MKRTICLTEFKINQEGTILKVNGEGLLRRRLFDMGVTPTAQIIVIKRAPFGDPIELTVRGYELSIRKADAEMVEVL